MNSLEASATRWDRWADTYDSVWADLDTDSAVRMLARLAAGGPALDLGAGTGRVALPLAATGTKVIGLELSPRMAAIFRRGLDDTLPAEVRIGDMAAGTGESSTYSLVYCVFNSFFELQTQEAQIRCLTNARKSLRPDGKLLLELHMPSAGGLLGDWQHLSVRSIQDDAVSISAIETDPVNQVIRYQELAIGQSGIQLLPVVTRYVWPAELDLMARIAGLRLVNRWSDWRESPMDKWARKHVSVYAAEV